MKIMEKALFGALLLFFATSCFAEEKTKSVLDRPIRLSSCIGLYNVTMELRKSMDPTDWDSFMQAESHLLVSIDTDIAHGATQAQQDSIVTALASGMTPRRIIVLGFSLRLVQVKKAELEEELKLERGIEKKRPAGTEGWALSEEKIAVDAIMKYSSGIR